MAETLRWDFVGNDRLTDVLEKIDKTLDKVDRSLGDFGRTAKTTAADVKIIEAEIVDLGDEAKKTDEKVKKVFRGLPAEIAAAKLAVKQLTAEFARTGDVEVLKQLKGQKSLLKELEGAKADVAKFVKEGADEGKNFAQKFGSSMLDQLNNSFPSELKSILLVAAATAAIAAAPLIGGAVSAAVLGGVGIGGVVGGVALAVQDSRVQAAFAEMGGEIMATLRDSASPFVEPLLRVPAQLKAEFAGMVPDLRGIFGDLSGEVEPLARGLAGLVREALPGIRRAVSASVPLVNSLARVMPELGRTISKFFEMISDGSGGAEKALLVIIRIFEGLLLGVGAVIKVLSVMFEMMAKVPGPLQDLSKQAAELGNSGTEAFESFSGSLDAATTDLLKFSDAFDQALGKDLDLQHATIAYERAVDDVTKTLMSNKRTLDIHTETGRQNREAILSLVEAAKRQQQATIAQTGDVEAANQQYAAHIDWIRKTSIELGYNKEQVEELTAAARDVPRDVGISVRLDGAGFVSSALRNMGDTIARLTGNTYVSSGLSKRKRALGGAVMPGELYQVQEQREEYFQPAMPGRITTSAPGGSLPDETVLAPVTIMMEGERMWSGMLAFKRRSGKVSLGLA